jgi:hypothetical protein
MAVVVRDPTKYLKQFITERVGRALAPHEVVYILKTAARELLPAAGLKGKCPQLELFSDWSVHNELDRSPAGQAAIARIAEAIPLYGEGGRDNKWLEEEVNGGISFWSLRLELLDVCRSFGLPDDIFATWAAWTRFALPLAFEVSGRLVRLGAQATKATKAAKDRIAKSGLHPDHQPNTLRLVHIEGDKHQNGFHWEVGLPAATIVIQVLFGGFRLGDFPTPAGWQSSLGPQGIVGSTS